MEWSSAPGERVPVVGVARGCSGSARRCLQGGSQGRSQGRMLSFAGRPNAPNLFRPPFFFQSLAASGSNTPPRGC